MGHPLRQNPATDSVILVLVAVLPLVLLLLRLLLLLSPSHVLCLRFKLSRKAESGVAKQYMILMTQPVALEPVLLERLSLKAREAVPRRVVALA
jgi:hypothetical protein